MTEWNESQLIGLRLACIEIELAAHSLETAVGASPAMTEAREQASKATRLAVDNRPAAALWRLMDCFEALALQCDARATALVGADLTAEADEGQYDPDEDDLGWENPGWEDSVWDDPAEDDALDEDEDDGLDDDEYDEDEGVWRLVAVAGFDDDVVDLLSAGRQQSVSARSTFHRDEDDEVPF